MDKGVSVIIPCHYDWEFVKECLDSVKYQLGVNTQVICVYNEAYDNNKLFNNLKKQKGIDLIPNYQGKNSDRKLGNYGAASARNVGLRAVKKQTVMFVDDDDKIGWIPPNQDRGEGFDPYYLQHFYDILNDPTIRDENHNIISGYYKPVSMVAGDVVKTDDDRRTNYNCIPKNYVPQHRPFTLDQVLRFLNGRNSSCAVLYRTEIINKYKLKFNTSFTYHEDTDFVMRYALAASYESKYILATPRYLKRDDWEESYYWYRTNQASVMGETTQRSHKKWESITKRAEDSLRYYASMADTVAKREDLGIYSETYKQLLMDYRDVVKEYINNNLDIISDPNNTIRPKSQDKERLEKLAGFLPEKCYSCPLLNTIPGVCNSELCPFYDNDDNDDDDNGNGGDSGHGGNNGHNLPTSMHELLDFVKSQETTRKKSRTNTQNKEEQFREAMYRLQMYSKRAMLKNTLSHMTQKELIELQCMLNELIRNHNAHTK